MAQSIESDLYMQLLFMDWIIIIKDFIHRIA